MRVRVSGRGDEAMGTKRDEVKVRRAPGMVTQPYSGTYPVELAEGPEDTLDQRAVHLRQTANEGRGLDAEGE